uniref:Floral homeotic protein PMADS 2 n=1 Tax=Anthurium amnicola TaxID=1678845 RepID=A0A1D1XMT0_9ARAE
MGRGKVEIKKIENSTNRQVTYTKRRNGIVKKAKEISVLCNAKVYLVIFSSSGKMTEFCSDNATLSAMLEDYQKHTGNRIWDAKHENLNAEIDRVKKENDNMQIELRHLKGEDITPLSPFELIPLEESLQKGLAGVRDKQMDHLKKLRKNGIKLEDENKQLASMLREIAMNGGARELDQEYEQTGRDYSSQMPFPFRGRPIQPKLQQNK